jgi:hypothetical protein
MSRVFSVILLIPLYFLCMALLLFNLTLNTEVESLEKFKLSRAINYATDAAANEMLSVGHLAMDYTDKNRMTLDPRVALETFCDVFAINYDLPNGSIMREYLQTMYLPLFAVAVYDGYYVYERYPSFRLNPAATTDANNKGLISTPKLPYSYRTASGSYYALNLGLQNAIKFNNGALSKVFVSDAGLTNRNEVKRQINIRVSDDLMWRMDMLYETGIKNTIYIPYNMTSIYNTNSIEGPTVFAYINDFNINTRYRLEEFAIGGTEVEEKRMVAAYMIGGKKLYSYADLLPGGFDLNTIENMYASTIEAAIAGYYHDAAYMSG